jgi:predicted DNA-binding transcriptional regulator AlpA
MTERLLSIADVMAQLGIRSRTTWAKVRKHEDFPAPLSIPGLSRPRWRQEDLSRWMDNRVNGSGQPSQTDAQN